MKENWYALLAAILNADLRYTGPAHRCLGVEKSKRDYQRSETETAEKMGEQMIKDYGSENTIMRINYETGESFNTVPAVINAGGQLPQGWKNEDGQHVLRKPRRPVRERSSWEGMITERREWKTGAEEAVIKLNEEGMKWTAIADLYGVNRKTPAHRITRYKKLKKQLEK